MAATYYARSHIQMEVELRLHDKCLACKKISGKESHVRDEEVTWQSSGPQVNGNGEDTVANVSCKFLGGDRKCHATRGRV